MWNMGIFANLVCSSPSRLKAQWVIRNMSNIYDTLLKNPVSHWYFKNSRHIQNQVKYLCWKILYPILCDPSIFRTLTYSEYCQTSVTKYFIQNLVQPWHIQKPSIFNTLVYSEIKAYSEPCQISKMELLIKNPM